MSTSTLSHKCHKEEMFSEVNFTISPGELRQLPTNDKKGYSEPILRITDRAMSSQQVVIHNTAGDSYELFPTCHSLCSAASVCPSNCSPVDFTLAPTAGYLADLPGRFPSSNYLWTFFRKTEREKEKERERDGVNIPEGESHITGADTAQYVNRGKQNMATWKTKQSHCFRAG